MHVVSDHLIKIIASGIPITTTATNHESSKRKYDKKIALLSLLLEHNNNVIVCFYWHVKLLPQDGEETENCF